MPERFGPEQQPYQQEHAEYIHADQTIGMNMEMLRNKTMRAPRKPVRITFVEIRQLRECETQEEAEQKLSTMQYDCHYQTACEVVRRQAPSLDEAEVRRRAEQLQSQWDTFSVYDERLRENVTGVEAIFVADEEELATFRGQIETDPEQAAKTLEYIREQQRQYALLNRIRMLQELQQLDEELYNQYLENIELAETDPEKAAEVELAIIQKAIALEEERNGFSKIGTFLARSQEFSAAELFRQNIPIIADVVATEFAEAGAGAAAKKTVQLVLQGHPEIARALVQSRKIETTPNGEVLADIEGSIVRFTRNGETLQAAYRGADGIETEIQELTPTGFEKTLFLHVLPREHDRAGFWTDTGNQQTFMQRIMGVDLGDNRLTTADRTRLFEQQLASLPKTQRRIADVYLQLGVIESGGSINVVRAELFGKLIKYLSNVGELQNMPADDFTTIAHAWSIAESRGYPLELMTAKQAEQKLQQYADMASGNATPI